MATSKFFTWTKGAHDAHKARRKPLLLDCEQASDARSSKSSRTTDSIALQDAAVQSATSLLVVMNDCLNNHLLSTQQQSAGLQPMHGRPRSRTAPSTPMFEMPESIDPVELPDSSPALKPSFKGHTVHQSMDGKSICTILSTPNQKSLDERVKRPHSGHQDSPFTFPIRPRDSSDSFANRDSSLRPPTSDVVPRARTAAPSIPHPLPPGAISHTSDDTLVASENNVLDAPLRRPSLSYLATWQHKQPTILDSQAQSRETCNNLVSPMQLGTPRKDSCVINLGQATEAGADLFEQLAVMRASHGAHISSLKEAHERELASQRTYISILEKRCTAVQTPLSPPGKNLTIDTSHIAGKDGGIVSSRISTTVPLHLFDSPMENQKRSATETTMEAEALKRTLSLCRKAQSELGDVRRECDRLREATKRNDRRIVQLKDMVRKGKDNEKGLKDSLSGLEAALLSANMQRTDVLEGFHEACGQLEVLVEREKCLIRERDEFRHRLENTDPAWNQRTGTHSRPPPLSQEFLPVATATLRQDPLIQTLDELRSKLSEKDNRIRDLESTVTSLEKKNSVPSQGLDDCDANTDVKEHAECEKRLAAAQAERDQYNSLLHAELRRQTRAITRKPPAATLQIEDEANSNQAPQLEKTSGTPGCHYGLMDSEDTVCTLQRELKHFIQEIVLYKLDIKGYKKDLKQAAAQILTLKKQIQNLSNAPTSPDNTPVQQQTERTQNQDPRNGLGISGITHAPTTPTRNIANTTTSALMSTSPALGPPITTLSPSHRPVTPLDKHKRLPNPPTTLTSTSPFALMSPPIYQVTRHETLRSLSDSIVSLYAKRRTPEQGTNFTSPGRPQSSDQQRTAYHSRPPSPKDMASLYSLELPQRPPDSAIGSGSC